MDIVVRGRRWRRLPRTRMSISTTPERAARPVPGCGLRGALAPEASGGGYRGGSHMGEGLSDRAVPVFTGISGSCPIRQGRWMCSHVHRPPCAHMGAHQLILTDITEPQNRAENRHLLRRGPPLPCATLPRAPQSDLRSPPRHGPTANASPDRGRAPSRHSPARPRTRRTDGFRGRTALRSGKSRPVSREPLNE